MRHFSYFATHFLIAIVALFGLLACTKSMQYKSLPDSDYYVLEQNDFDRFLVKSPQALRQYDRIIFSALNFDKFELQSSGQREVDDSWGHLSHHDKLVFAKYFKSELLRIFAGENVQTLYGLGTERNSKTLYAEVRLLSLLPRVPLHGANTSGTVSEKAVDTFGSLTIQVVLVDSVTEEFVGLIEDGRSLNTGSNIKTIVNASQQGRVWKRAFHAWLGDLKATLEATHSLQ